MNDISQDLQAAVLQAAADATPLCIIGNNNKAFYGRAVDGTPLVVAKHQGVVSYEPTELVITARAGTPLREIEATLATSGQRLGFEPPYFGENATLGGAIACGLSGPCRPYTGSARDFVLGMQILNGQGQILRFGGQVMKNVAGYDIPRLMTGTLGTLGVVLEISLKVLPKPAEEQTLVQSCSAEQAVSFFNIWAGKPYPLSAAAYDGEQLYLRLSGLGKGVAAARRQIGGEVWDQGADFWTALREQTHPFFQGDLPLWRLSLPPATPPMDMPSQWLLDWGGAQRWLRSEVSVGRIRDVVLACGGHATLFRGGDRQSQIFQPLQEVVLRLHRNLKHSFDPQGIFNPGRLYADF